jgi:lipid-binding SYLF domain-containing protein
MVARMPNLPSRALLASLAAVLLLTSTPTLAEGTLDDRIALSTEALEGLLEDSPPPRSLIDDTTCIAVLPRVIQAAVGIGGRHGKGVMSCRREDGGWSPPAFINISGGSLGLQIGAEASDLVLLIVDERSARSLLRSKFTIGASGKAAAGPRSAGTEATTDARLDAEIYSYGSSKGFFAGVSLGGAKLKLNRKQVSNYYPEQPLPEDLLFGSAEVSETGVAAAFRAALP